MRPKGPSAAHRYVGCLREIEIQKHGYLIGSKKNNSDRVKKIG